MMSAGYSGAARQPGVFETVHACGEAATDLFRAMRVRDHGKITLVRFVDDGAHLLHRHLVLIDQLDDVHAAVGELCTFARASATPFTPQRNPLPGYGSCWMNGPETYSVAPGIFPALIVAHGDDLASSGAPRSRALVTPASSSCFADAGMITDRAARVRPVPVRVVA